ncbi:N-acetylmuramoyl-L-alanine amidase [Prauserella isguenensis]|uniref:N-acetylmuramoyl-L-alanine amidase n=1 Tax=Prauserella isguenensis TaxID=1470180 RepID=A0A839RWG7_9PSEU|nr:N-acetylmuramoyl-L-alanine amidase [Prauserella isguenensis]
MRSSGGTFTIALARGVAVTAGLGMLLTGCSPAEPAADGDVGDERAATQRSASAGSGRDSGSDSDVGDSVVVLDPGHNGRNAANPDRIGREVPNGRGDRKQCNSTGTSTADGYGEHAFNFAVAQHVKRMLVGRGVDVVLTRPDDNGVGPCVDERAAIGNRNEADAVVSIHADGTSADASGFHVIYSAPPLNDAQQTAAPRLARDMVAGMSAAGLAKSDYIASEEGIDARDDLAGLNLSTVPAVLVECGNMRNTKEAAAMSTSEGRRRYADAITRGLLRYLDR